MDHPLSAQIACCPTHGLHGERRTCYVCGGPVEQVDMIEVSWDGLLAHLETHYPAAVFTGESGDPGAHIVALIRLVERYRQALIPFAFIGRGSMEPLGLLDEYLHARGLLGL